MSVRGNPTETVSTETTYRTASYTPCEDCGEGAMVWNEKKGASECNCCGSVYTGRE
jgi:ribosomal protein S27E